MTGLPAVIELRLAADPAPVVYPARLHGAACALLEPPSTQHTDGRKPFSVWPLIADGQSATWRLGWLGSEPTAPAPRYVTFGPTRHEVLDSRVDETSFAEIARTRPRRHAAIEVLSPLYFSRNGRDHPLPDPVLMTRSALDRWDHHAPPELAVPLEARRELLSTVYLAEMNGSTVAGAVGATTCQTGFVGHVALALTRQAGESTQALFAAMLRFAHIAGLGAQTTHGFGAVQLIAEGLR